MEIYDSTNTVIGCASGFLINDNATLVTNYHVIEDAYRIVVFTADGNKSVDVNTVLAYNENAERVVVEKTMTDEEVRRIGEKTWFNFYNQGIISEDRYFRMKR